MQIYVEGNIATGKSTLLKHISSTRFENVDVVFEPVDRWTNLNGQNLLGKFYQDNEKHGFALQVVLFICIT